MKKSAFLHRAAHPPDVESSVRAETTDHLIFHYQVPQSHFRSLNPIWLPYNRIIKKLNFTPQESKGI